MKKSNIIIYFTIIIFLAAVLVVIKQYYNKHQDLCKNLINDVARIENTIADTEEYRLSKIGVSFFKNISFFDDNLAPLNQADITAQFDNLLLVVSNNNCFDCILHLKRLLGQIDVDKLSVVSISGDIDKSIEQAKLFGRKDNSILGLYQDSQNLEINGEYPMIVSLNSSGVIADIYVSSRYYKDDLNLLRLKQFIAKYGN